MSRFAHLIAAVCCAAVMLGGCRLAAPTAAEQPDATPVRVPIITGDVVQTVTATGAIAADKTANRAERAAAEQAPWPAAISSWAPRSFVVE